MIYNRIRDLMDSQKISYRDLERATSIDKASLQRYCTGKTVNVPADRLWTIAFVLGTTPAYLMGETDDPSPSYATQMVKYSQDSARTIHKEIANELTSMDQEDLIGVLAYIRARKEIDNAKG